MVDWSWVPFHKQSLPVERVQLVRDAVIAAMVRAAPLYNLKAVKGRSGAQRNTERIRHNACRLLWTGACVPRYDGHLGAKAGPNKWPSRQSWLACGGSQSSRCGSVCLGGSNKRPALAESYKLKNIGRFKMESNLRH